MSKRTLTYDTGKSPTAKVYAFGTSTLSGTFSLTETATNYYTGTFPTIAAGIYDVIYFDSTSPIATETVKFDGTSVEDAQTTLDAIKTQITSLGSGSLSVTYVLPMISGKEMEITRGDDYTLLSGQSIPFTFTGLPYSLTGATAVMTIASQSSRWTVQVTGVVTGAAACYFEIPKSQTKLLDPEVQYDFDVQFTLANGATVTPIIGTVTVNEDVTA